MTSHHAVMTKGRVVAGTRLGIIGLGGLGQIGARVGVLAGAEVYVAELNEEVWDLADELGVTGIARSIRDFADKRLDVIVDFAGFGTTTAEAIETVRFAGRVVQVGMGKLEATISTRDLILKECELVGSRGGTSDDIAGVYELFASGQLTPHYTEIGFDDIPDGLDRLARGEVKGRLVARINDAS
jgi:propanol-preferring alcohol dehydrogenase